jgi:hypothetical protein
MHDSQRFADGYAFYKSGGLNAQLLPAAAEDHREWVKGFCCAMADYDPWQEDPTIQAALLHRGICSDLLAELLQAAEAVIEADQWVRWPPVPVRGWRRPPADAADPVEAMPPAAWPNGWREAEGGPEGPGAVIV